MVLDAHFADELDEETGIGDLADVGLEMNKSPNF
jgi:hypothetical protein